MTADVIEGPWKKIDKTEKELEIARVLAECDQITSDCVVDVLQNLVENGIAPDDPDDESIVYIMFLTDLIKAIVYKGADIEHPFQDIAFMLCGTAEEDGMYNVASTCSYAMTAHPQLQRDMWEKEEDKLNEKQFTLRN